MRQLKTFEERFKYLKLGGIVGDNTFGFDRYINQKFYKSAEWKRVRDIVILRDNACDLGMPDRQLNSRVYIHHMNPIAKDDIEESTEYLLNPEYLVCVSQETHNAIHYGDSSYLERNKIANRGPNDMTPWKK